MKLKASINLKVNLIIILSLIVMGAVTIAISAYSLKKQGALEVKAYETAILEEKKELLRSLVSNAHTILEFSYLNYRKANTADAEPYKKKALEMINSMRFGEKNDYFYAMDTVAKKMIQHPNRSNVGKDAHEFVDPNGKKLIVSQINIALDKGSGFDQYKWKRLGEVAPVPKLTYVKHFKEWNIAIATGVYTDDIQLALERKKEEFAKTARDQIITLIMVVAGLIVLTVILAFFIVYGGIVKPIREMIELLKDVAEGEGDLTKRIIDDSGDETEEMAGWFNQFIEKIQVIIKDVAKNVTALETASGSLTDLASNMATSAEQTSQKATSVAAAGNEMSHNMTSVAAAMEEASSNVSMVASATEEMSSTIHEIATNTEKAREITAEAVSRTNSASGQVGELGVAAKEIGNVVETITDISGQVDLLALNATIEAARAGEAGKGLAGGANEIKELARQTAEATGEIKERVEGIQSTTEGTVQEINSVSGVVDDIDKIVSTIATAVEEQSATTSEIVNNVTQASAGLGEVNENVAQSSMVSGEIAGEIGEVTDASQEISNGCSRVHERSDELSELAHKLHDLVGKFKV